jgi:hypothetical protein
MNYEDKTMTKSDLVGTWKLISWETKKPDGTNEYPFGDNPIGYLIYTKDEYMSVNIMRENRLPIAVASEELMKVRQIFLKPWLLINAWKYLKATLRYLNASANYVSYSGKYSLEGDKIIHHVEISLIPDWTGTDLVRTCKMLDNQLLLITPPLGDDPQYLTWERVV